MAKLVFKSDHKPQHASDIAVDTADVLAVVNLGYQALVGNTFAHRRQIITKDSEALQTVWALNNDKTPPAAISTLDKMGGKPFITVAKLSSPGTGNASELATANRISLSTAPEDKGEITKTSAHASKLAKAGLSGAFADSAQPVNIADSTLMYYASLDVGDQKVEVGHLKKGKFDVFENKALTPA